MQGDRELKSAQNKSMEEVEIGRVEPVSTLLSLMLRLKSLNIRPWIKVLDNSLLKVMTNQRSIVAIKVAIGTVESHRFGHTFVDLDSQFSHC